MKIQEMLEITNTHFEKYMEYFPTKEDCVKNSYTIALAGMFRDCLQEYVFEPDFFEDDEMEENREQYEILFAQDNIYHTLVHTFFDFSHPERTDVWGYHEGWAGTKEVIDDVVEILKTEGK